MRQGWLFGGLLLVSAVAQADSHRSGWYLAGGIGAHASELTTQDSNDNEVSDSGNGLLLSVKLGGHVHPQLALYYHGESRGWYENVDEALYSSTLNGLGLTYYFSPVGGGGYLESALGFGLLSAVGSDDNEVEPGSGYLIGVGYDVTRNFQFGLSYSSVSADDSEIRDLRFRSTSIALKAEWTY